MSKLCPHCRCDNADDAQVCSGCGKPLQDSAASVPDQASAKKSKLPLILGGAVLLAAALVLLFLLVLRPANRYQAAEALLTEGSYQAAEAAFAELGDYKDAADRVLDCRYQQAQVLLQAEDYAAAEAVFAELGDYKDAADRVLDCRYQQEMALCYQQAEALLEENADSAAALAFVRLGDYKDAPRRAEELLYSTHAYRTLAMGLYGMVGLKDDGTVLYAPFDEEDAKAAKQIEETVAGWTDVVSVAAGNSVYAALKSDGTVVCADNHPDYDADVSSWKDIVSIVAGGSDLFGLKANGTVVQANLFGVGQTDFSLWTDIVALDAGDSYLLGLKADGTVLSAATGFFPSTSALSVSEWTDVVRVWGGMLYSYALTEDGRVLSTDPKEQKRIDALPWKDVSCVEQILVFTVGLGSDGFSLFSVYDQSKPITLDKKTVFLCSSSTDAAFLLDDGTVLVSSLATAVVENMVADEQRDRGQSAPDWTEILADCTLDYASDWSGIRLP